MSFPIVIQGDDQQIYTTRTTKGRAAYGQRMELSDGRVYRWTEAGGNELAAAYMNQGQALDTNLDTLAVQAAVSVGDTTIPFTMATTFFVKDEAANGFLAIESAAALGHCYRIASNTAASAGSTTCTVTLESGVTVIVTLTTSHKVTPIKNLWKDTVVCPTTTPTAVLAGVNPVVIAANAYGWLQTKGLATCFVVGTWVSGDILIPAGSTAGSLGPADTQGTTLTQAVGRVVEIAPTTDFGLVMIDLD